MNDDVGEDPGPRRGRVHRINLSDGGVPKLPVAQAEVTPAGVAGDRQQDLKHHGGPDRAVCLYSLEAIAALRDEGHRIEPGAAGENLTLAGIPWASLHPGVVLRVGPRVVLEVVSYTEPCGKIRGLFADGNPQRIDHRQHPGWSRLYARVLQPGPVAVGDEVLWREP